MAHTSKRAIRPSFDDLEGRQLLSTLPATSPVAPTIVNYNAEAATASKLGESTNFDWARWVLHDGKWPESRNNITVITQWMASEEPTKHWWNRNNPLNNGLGSGGGSGLGRYPNLLVAAYYVALNLEEGTAHHRYGYGAIVADLKASAAPSKTAKAIWDSQWAASHYSYGRAWHSGPVATVAAPRSAW